MAPEQQQADQQTEQSAGGANVPEGQPRQWGWIAVTAGLAVAILVITTSVLVMLRPGDDQADPGGVAPAAATPEPTWDMTARPVPDQHGDYGRHSREYVGQQFVIELFSWSAGEPQGAGMLSRVRDWTTDEFFARMVENEARPRDWTSEDQKAGTTRKVSIMKSYAPGLVFEESENRVYVMFQLIDTAADGTVTRSNPKVITLIPGTQVVELPRGNGVVQIEEVRIADIESYGDAKTEEDDGS